MPYRTVPLGRFGGRNEDTNVDALRPGELTDDLNVYLRGTTIGTRPGLVRDTNYDSDFPTTVSAAAVQGIYEYRADYDATRNLIVVANGAFYVLSGGSPTDRTGATTITAGKNNKWTFATFKDQVYAAGGADSDSLLVWDGGAGNNATAHTLEDSGGNAIDANYIFEKWGRLWLAGFDGSKAEDNPMVVRHTHLFSDTFDPALTIGGTGVGGFGSFGGEFLTGFGSYTDNQGDWLMVLSNQRLFSIAQTGSRLAPFAISDVVQNGCVSQHAFVNLGLDSGDAIYASTKGIHSLRQSQQFGGKENRFLSWKIRETWKTLNRNRITEIVGAYMEDEGIVLFAVSTGSNTTHDTILALDVKNIRNEPLNADTAKWYVWRLGGSAAANILYAARDENDDPALYVGTAVGDVGKFSTVSNTGTGTFSDFGEGYEVLFQTAHHDYDRPGVEKQVGDTNVRIQPGGDYSPTHQVIFDLGDSRGKSRSIDMATSGSATWDSAEWDVAEWPDENVTFRRTLYSTGSGETIAHRFFHGGTNEPFWISGVSTELELAGEAFTENT